MIEKRFVDNGFEAIEDQSFTDTKTNKTYYVDYFDEIVDLVNQLNDESKQLKEEIADKGVQLDFLKAENMHMSEVLEENRELKSALTELKEIGDYQSFRIEELFNENDELEKENTKLKERNEYLNTEWRIQKEIIATYGKRINFKKNEKPEEIKKEFMDMIMKINDEINGDKNDKTI